MSIQSIVQNIKTKRAMKKAEEAGQALASQGVTSETPRTTTGSYVVTTPSGTTTVSPTGTTSTYTPSKGGGTSGGGTSGGGTSRKDTTPTITPTGFSGKVEEIDVKTGKTTKTEFFVEGKETGSIFEDKGITYSKTEKPSRFTFETPTKEGKTVQEVYLIEGGASISEYDLIRGGDGKTDIVSMSGISSSDLLGGDIGRYNAGTKIDTDFKIDTSLYSPGTTYAIQTGEFKKVPTFSVYTVKEDWSSDIATSEEVNRLFPSEIIVGEGRKTEFGKVFGEKKGKLKQFSTKEFESGFFIEEKVSDWSSKGGKARQITGGIVSGIIPTTKGEFLTTAGSFALGAGIGGVIKGGGISLSYIPKAGKYIAPMFNIGTLVGGGILTGDYALKTVTAISIEEGYYSKGEIIGESFREFGVIGLGYGVGAKQVGKGYGILRTLGREEIPLENLLRESVISGKESFPTAPPKTHLKLFQETTTKIPQLTEGTPGGFHATPEQFWGKEIVPNFGTSELSGLYIGSEPSIHFTGIQGGGYTFKFPTLKSLTAGEKPALAFLKPKGFRETGFQVQETPLFQKQRPYGKKYAYFEEPAISGVIDVPKMKTEIEGIARPEAGKYIYESGKYYTTIKGERVPIDVFIAEGGKIELKLSKIKGFKSREYGYTPEEISLIDIRSSIGKGLSSYGKGYSRPSSISYSQISSSLPNYSYYSKRTTKSYFPTSYKRKYYFGSSFVKGYSGASSSFYTSYYPSSTKTPRIKLPSLDFPKGASIIRGERLFIETPTFGTVLGKEFGISFKTSGLGGYSGLGEREYKTGIKLPTTILKTVQKKEFKL